MTKHTYVVFRGNEKTRRGFHTLSIGVWLVWLVPYFVGMLIGAAFAHNFGLAGAAASAATAEKAAVLGGPSVAGQIVLVCCIAVLFVIAIVNVRKQKTAA